MGLLCDCAVVSVQWLLVAIVLLVGSPCCFQVGMLPKIEPHCLVTEWKRSIIPGNALGIGFLTELWSYRRYYFYCFSLLLWVRALLVIQA